MTQHSTSRYPRGTDLREGGAPVCELQQGCLAKAREKLTRAPVQPPREAREGEYGPKQRTEKKQRKKATEPSQQETPECEFPLKTGKPTSKSE